MQLSEVNLTMVRAIVALQEAEVEGLLESAYKVPSPAQLRSKLSGKAGGLTKYAVERLRKDFLTLMKNLKRVKTYDEAERVKKAVFRWRDHYEDIISQIGPEIDGLLRMEKMKKSWERKVNEGWAKEYRDNQTPIWLFRSAMWDFPLTRYEKKPKWTNAYSKEELFADYQAKYKAWERRVRRKSQAAWKWLRDLVEWTESTGAWGGGGEPLPIRHPGSDVVLRNIAGFSVQLRGYDPDDETRASEKWMGQFERGLAHYKQRAQRVMPWLIKYQLPLVLHFVENQRLMGSRSAAATYSHDHINVNIFGMSGTPGKVAKVLAHEMGHHLYQSVLSQRMRDDWKQLVTGEQADLDLRKVLAMRTRDHDGDLENELHFEKRIRKENPTLALQLATLMDDPRYKDLDLWSLAAIEDYLEKGGNPILKVSARPITGYAAKNPEEAFCEAIGLLVGFGPRTLLPIYQAALKKLFPELRVESKGGLSGALQEALTERVTGFSKSGERFSVPTPKEMGFKAPKTPVGKLPTGKFHLTKSVVKRLREDYLTLMRSGKKVKSQDEAEEWNAAVARFDGLLSRFKAEIELYLERLEWKADYDSATDEDRRIAQEASEWKSKIGRIQDFYLNPPVKSFAFYSKQDGASKEQLFQHFKHEFPAWDASTKRRARIAWRWLDDLTAWAADKSGVRGAGGEPVVLSRPERRNVRIEGFNVSTIGEMDPAHMARLKEALKVYRRRAQKYLPALLKHKLPFEVESEMGAGKAIIANAYYGKDRIIITPWGLSARSIDDLVRTIAHEMGHHLQGRVSKKNWLLWYDYWQGGKKPIDLRKVLAMQKPGESDRDFGNRLKKADPVLHMRLSALNYRAGFSVPMMKAEIERGKPMFMASQRMPSAYAATFADEGFAEVIGHLVAFGPRTIPRETLAFLKRIVPGTRVESLAGQLEEAIITEKAKGKIRASKLQYVHFTDAKGALGMVKEKKIWQSDYAAPAVYAVAVGGSYVPGVQLSKMGRAPKGRDVAIVFTTDEFPDVLNPEEVLWHKREIRVKSAKIIPTSRAIKLLDGSLVKGDELKGIPAHPSTFDWDAGRVRKPERKPVGRVV